jgi:UDP-N-acetylmuramyl pentapeptide phosphotransferase/UDP-N-acetylglucosamine-1-phosphate transferase
MSLSEIILFIFFTSVVSLITWFLVMVLCRWAERRQFLDIPNERSLHTGPIPRGGGIPIVLIALIGLMVYSVWDGTFQWEICLTYIIGATLIAAISWLDDLRPLPNWVRFSAHSVGAILVILGFGSLHSLSLPFLRQLHLGWLSLPVTFLWIVGLTNAYNFMDGIDGIAGGQAVVAGFGWTALGCLSGQPIVSAIGLLLATSSLGFLGHNWSPARIFMGDVGSAFLGYTFAVLPIIAAQKDPRLALAGVLLVWPFVFDTVFTFLRRLRGGENVFAAHRSHLYQRLVIAGYSHGFVSSFYIGLALIGGILALAWSQNVVGSNFAVVLSVPFFCLILWIIVNRKERNRAFVS